MIEIILLLVLMACVIYQKPIHDPVNILIRQASRWSVASQQDESPMIALLHANYAVGFLWALQDIATERDIERVLGRGKLSTFRKKIVTIQDKATQAVSSACPRFMGPEVDEYLTKLAGDN